MPTVAWLRARAVVEDGSLIFGGIRGVIATREISITIAKAITGLLAPYGEIVLPLRKVRQLHAKPPSGRLLQLSVFIQVIEFHKTILITKMDA
jgi:hypothetical protein